MLRGIRGMQALGIRYWLKRLMPACVYRRVEIMAALDRLLFMLHDIHVGLCASNVESKFKYVPRTALKGHISLVFINMIVSFP